MIEFAELEEFLDLKLKNYSSGMQVRLAFSLMVQSDAEVLLIDEVLAVGDAAFQQKCFNEFYRLRDEGRTIILVTHDMTTIERFCHSAMLLEHGRIVTQGDPVDVGARYMELNFEHQRGRAGEEAPEPGRVRAPRRGSRSTAARSSRFTTEPRSPSTPWSTPTSGSSGPSSTSG